MRFSSQQLSSEKWGIYSEGALLATISCQKTCEIIIANLQTGRRDAPPTSSLKQLYKAPKLKKHSHRHTTEVPAAATAHTDTPRADKSGTGKSSANSAYTDKARTNKAHTDKLRVDKVHAGKVHAGDVRADRKHASKRKVKSKASSQSSSLPSTKRSSSAGSGVSKVSDLSRYS